MTVWEAGAGLAGGAETAACCNCMGNGGCVMEVVEDQTGEEGDEE